MESLGDFEYRLSDVLGHGSYAMVFKGNRKRDNLQVAVKKIPLKSVPGKLSSIRQEEILILKDLKNPHIVQLYDYLDRGSDIFLVMEYCNGGDMGDYLADKKTLSESSIRHLFKHIALALESLYKLKIIHRDIKPQNLLLSYPSSPSHSSSASSTPFSSATHSTTKRPLTEATIKLADFGFARHLYGADMAATLCGSPLYMAPEILVGQRYDHSADLWSVGVILYQCLSGSAPFLASDPHALRKRYKKEGLVPKVPPGTSHYLSDLLISLLKKNPRERLPYNDFFNHEFLKDPSTLFPEDSIVSHHTKSSPVPIKRKGNAASSALSNSPSPKQSISPHRSLSVDTSHFSSPSYSSGPPLSHRIGSQTSLACYNVQSPNSYTDITDQGFILVDFPGNPGSRRCSVSSSGGQSSGRNSSMGYTHSGQSTPSAGVVGVASNSLTKYSSLTTPFYQAPPPSTRPNQQQQQQPQVLKGNGGKTPKAISSPFGTSIVRSPEFIQTSRPTPPSSVPFGKLMKCTGNLQTLISSNPNSMGTSQPQSIFSTPPSSLSSPGAHHHVVVAVSKGVISRRNSSSKLSALTEEKFHQNDGHLSGRKKDSHQGSSDKNSSGGFDIITKSCLLDSEDDIENISAAEEDNFPAGLDMSFTEFEDEDACSEEPKVLVATTPEYPASGEADHRLQYHTGQSSSNFHLPSQVPQLPPPLMPQSQDAHFAALPLGSGKVGPPTTSRPRRAASFTDNRDSQLPSNKEGHVKSCSLTSAEYGTNPNFLKTRLLPSAETEEEITPMRVPFAFTGATLSRKISPESRGTPTQSHGGGGRHSNAAVPRGLKECNNNNKVSAQLGCLSLEEMRDILELAEEMQAMAKARQGPILLLSTSLSLSDSGVAGRFQRCSEQLVLYGKALSLLNDLSTRYGVELAMALHEEPPQPIAAMMEQVVAMKALCLKSARDVHDELLSGKDSDQSLELRVSAERLLFLEALDMGKAALLDEKSGGQIEVCLKRYRRAKLIFCHLLAEARTPHDKSILLKYLRSTQVRLSHLQSQLRGYL